MSLTKKKLSKAEVEKKVLRILQMARREPRFQVQRERDALIDAIRYGHLDIAHSLLAQGVDPNSMEPQGRSVLWHAAHWGQSDFINQRDTWGATALFDAAHEGRRQVARLLVAAGAKVNIKQRDGATPVSIARDRGFTDLADEIEEYTGSR